MRLHTCGHSSDVFCTWNWFWFSAAEPNPAGETSRENSEQTQKIKLFIIHTRTNFIKKLLWKFLYFFRLWGPLIKDKVYFVKQNHFQTHNKPRNCAVVFHSCKQTVCVKCTPNLFSQNKPLPRMCRRSASENPSVKMSPLYFIHFKHLQLFTLNLAAHRQAES